jgi:hypothetical protein
MVLLVPKPPDSVLPKLGRRLTLSGMAALLGLGLTLDCRSERQLELFDDEPVKPPKGCMDPMGCPAPEMAPTSQCKGPECACSKDMDCPKDRPVCAAGSCVACAADEDCPMDQACNANLQRCARRCSAASACDKPTLCDLDRGYCVECTSEKDCSMPDRPACEPETESCVECTADVHCGDPKRTHCDVAAHLCVDCTKPSKCDAGPCAVAPGCSN